MIGDNFYLSHNVAASKVEIESTPDDNHQSNMIFMINE